MLRINKPILVIVGLLVILPFCKKDKNKDDWQNCFDCSVDSWIGDFTGTAEYYDYVSGSSSKDISVSISIDETAEDYLFIQVVAPNYYSASISGDLVSNNSISFAGTGTSLSASLYKKDGQLRLTGSSKKFHYKVDSIIYEQSINFETLKMLAR